MTNKEIAKCFSELATLMELHHENPFKIKSYSNAYLTLRKLDGELSVMSDKELDEFPGIGKAISAKIRELVTTGQMEALEKYRSITPEGVRELLKVNGLGPKKIDAIWRKLEITSPGELLYACNENRLIELPGFGEKTQAEVKARLEFYFNASGKYLYQKVVEIIQPMIDNLNAYSPELKVCFSGQTRRKCPVIDQIELITVRNENLSSLLIEFGEIIESDVEKLVLMLNNRMQVSMILVDSQEYGSRLFEYTGPTEFVKKAKLMMKSFQNYASEEELFKNNNLLYFPEVLRDNDQAIEDYKTSGKIPKLINYEDIKGVIHNHSTWSDGIHTLEEMALHVKKSGFEYFVISDHSKSAFYANGLNIDRVTAQWKEIEQLNKSINDFKIYKSIESDILSDGQLDYPEEILKGFDLVIASIHSNLNMDESKAMKRLISAIENPYTRILGHPTGRLLLSRKAYPVNHMKLIDACAANKVVIELNANPLRLDIDWTWIPYAIEKGVMISINPDAHSKAGIFDMHFGVYAAQKGALSEGNCLNCLKKADFEVWLKS